MLERDERSLTRLVDGPDEIEAELQGSDSPQPLDVVELAAGADGWHSTRTCDCATSSSTCATSSRSRTDASANSPARSVSLHEPGELAGRVEQLVAVFPPGFPSVVAPGAASERFDPPIHHFT